MDLTFWKIKYCMEYFFISQNSVLWRGRIKYDGVMMETGNQSIKSSLRLFLSYDVIKIFVARTLRDINIAPDGVSGGLTPPPSPAPRTFLFASHSLSLLIVLLPLLAGYWYIDLVHHGAQFQFHAIVNRRHDNEKIEIFHNHNEANRRSRFFYISVKIEIITFESKFITLGVKHRGIIYFFILPAWCQLPDFESVPWETSELACRSLRTGEKREIPLIFCFRQPNHVSKPWSIEHHLRLSRVPIWRHDSWRHT